MDSARDFSSQFANKATTVIHGEPLYSSINNLYNEVEADATSVQNPLRGGLHGYLGLVITDAMHLRD